MNSSIAAHRRIGRHGMCVFLSLALAPSLLRAADPVVVPPPAFVPAPGAKPQMGVNLEMLLDFARSMVFVDTIKSARKFGSPLEPWDEKAPLDANGWPTADAGVVVMADVAVPAGDYLFSCQGRCALGLINTKGAVHNLAYNQSANTTTATVSIDQGSTNLFLSMKNTAKGVQSIRLLRPGYPLTTDQVFSKEFLQAIAPFSTLRTMDFTRTNDTDVVQWSDRPKPEDAMQTTQRGVAWEYAIQLANQSKKDLWINIPDRANEEYIKQLAQLFKDKLDPDRALFFEYSNEVWNDTFKASGRNRAAAKAEVAAGDKNLNDNGQDSNEYYWAWKRVSKRLVEISATFKQVMGPDALNTRFRPVLASQSANPFMTRMQVEFIDKHFGPPSQFIYGIAGAPYLGPDDKVANRDSGATADDLIKATNAAGWVKDATTQYLLLARYYRLHHLCYEGGLAVDGEKNLAAKVQWNKDPRVKQMVDDYFGMWYSQGGELFMYYNLAGPWGKYGTWGLTDDIHIQTPKLKAVLDLISAPAPAISAGAAIPGIVQAAKFDAKGSGGGVEDSSDGGKNLAFLSDGHSFDYLLNVKEAGTYSLTMQSAGDPASKVEFSISGTALGVLNATSTGSGQKWGNTEPLSLKLEKGQYVLRLKVAHTGLNIRSITFAKTAG